MRYSLDAFKVTLKDRGVNLLSTKYTNIKEKYIYECPQCNEPFERKGEKMVDTSRNVTCSKCSHRNRVAKYEKPGNRICIKCGGEKANKRTSQFCKSCWVEESKENMNNYRTPHRMPDEQNPAWIGGSVNYWKKKVKEAGSCDKCGYDGIALTAHHLKSKSAYPELENELTNGVCLCANCHQEFHVLYGHDVNDKDYYEFKGVYNV